MSKRRAIFLFAGIFAEVILANAFDYGLYPFVIWKCGLLKGGAIMSLLSLAMCYVIMVFYSITKKDWFGIEMLKELREYEGEIRTLRLASWILKKGQFASFIFLSLKFDPFTTTAYMRSGANEFPKMNGKSWMIFFASWGIGNFSWIVIVISGISIAKLFWKIVT
jgi:predicted ferric reductase